MPDETNYTEDSQAKMLWLLSIDLEIPEGEIEANEEMMETINLDELDYDDLLDLAISIFKTNESSTNE